MYLEQIVAFRVPQCEERVWNFSKSLYRVTIKEIDTFNVM